MAPSDVENQECTSPSVEDEVSEGDELTPYEILSLMRLDDFKVRASEYAADPDHDEWLLGVLQRSIYSVYCDCLEIGLGDEAHKIVKRMRAVEK